jgi:(E)-4-hydroxy-3-methylbut-2-enyl-diphosphate synthase
MHEMLLLDIDDAAPLSSLSKQLHPLHAPRLIGLRQCGKLGAVRAYRLLHLAIQDSNSSIGTPIHPIVISLFNNSDLLHIAAICGALLADGIGDAMYLPDCPRQSERAFTLLQAMKARMTRADYVACPSCGRTLFDLIEVTAEIKAVTSHLDNVTVAIMGCIVNGPGEMADADFGYVGSGPGKITLYQGKVAVEKNIPTEVAKDRLVSLIKASGKWQEPLST